MKDFKKLNNLLGWLVGITSCIVFILTSEPSASYWDCGEFISCSYKLEVGHPPGAPTFLLLNRLASLLAFGDVTLVAKLMNYLSAIVSGLAAMFLFWIITYFAKKIFVKNEEEISNGNMYAVLGSGVVGALAFGFSDSHWFSAVETVVWSMASFFTAVIFWAATKWDSETNVKNSYRWIILIGFLIGLSIGVHLLNLLAIPAMGYLYYFKKYKPTVKGIIITTLISIGVTGVIFSIIIPQIVNLFAKFELFFVNTFHLPFNSGTTIFALLIVALIVLGLRYTIKKRKPMLNTVILAFTFLLIGYSTYLILVIRSNANTPLNENAPKNAIALLSYLNREQYGDWPVVYGPYYNAPLDSKKPYKDGNPHYTRDDTKGKYVITDDRKDVIPNFDSRFCTIFPRMWKSEKADNYKKWANIKGVPVSVGYPGGQTETVYKPTFGENLKFFFRYQVGYMYWRYFLWNFVGRQNDNQGGIEKPVNSVFGDPLNGNWISGIESIDKSLVGPIDLLPENLKDKRESHFFFLPLILGLIGMIFHFRNRYQDGLVVLLFFFMTGLAIILFLNQGPNEPRERDYSYACSMMAFCIWIGIGVIALFNQAKKYIKPSMAALLTTIICFICVPFVMGKNGWAGHDRWGRYTMSAVASDYLNSCAPNAILFTNGDNDTFPLWYAQEVEGVRRDVRVVNLSLFNTDWYIDAMKRKAYESDPLPISMQWDQYKTGTRDAVYFYEEDNVKGSVELKQLLDFALSDDPSTKLTTSSGKKVEYFPTRKFKITVDKKAVIASGTVPKELADSIVDKIEWTMKGFGVQKNDLAVLDIIAHNNWKRPIYFSITTGNEAYIGLEKYFQLEGLTYRFVPIKYSNNDGQIGRINTSAMYDNMMNKFKWGNMQDSTIYLDETNKRMTMNFRNNFGRLASALLEEGKKDSAVKALDKCMKIMPEASVPYNYFMLPIAEAYYHAGMIDKANKIMNRLTTVYEENLIYLFAFTGDMGTEIKERKEQALSVMNSIASLANLFKQDALSKHAKELLDKYYTIYTQGEGENTPPVRKRRQ